MPIVLSHGTRIDHVDQGQGGPALVFLPGWCGSRDVFDPLLARCSRWRRTLAIDWRGHGRSGAATDDFGTDDLVEDAIAVIEASGVETLVPVALSHAGWVAIELRRRLGARIAGIVLLDWIVLEPPPPFLMALQALQDETRWREVREQLFAMWINGLDVQALTDYVRGDMGSHGFQMWARAGREIGRAYEEVGSPFEALAKLDPPVPVLHLYAQPDDAEYLAAQQSLGQAHSWFRVSKLDARSHFPMFEVPEAMAEIIEGFAA